MTSPLKTILLPAFFAMSLGESQAAEGEEVQLMATYKSAKEAADQVALDKASVEIVRYCMKTAGAHPYAGMGPSPTAQCIDRLKGKPATQPLQIGIAPAAS